MTGFASPTYSNWNWCEISIEKKKEEFHFGQLGCLQREEEVKSESKVQAEQI